jgi:hypothetical protein
MFTLLNAEGLVHYIVVGSMCFLYEWTTSRIEMKKKRGKDIDTGK